MEHWDSNAIKKKKNTSNTYNEQHDDETRRVNREQRVLDGHVFLVVGHSGIESVIIQFVRGALAAAQAVVLVRIVVHHIAVEVHIDQRQLVLYCLDG